MINVTLKNGDVLQTTKGSTVMDVCKEISMGLFRAACSATINGEIVDLRTEINADCTLEILTFENDGGKKAFWHTSSHILAQAVKRLYPDAHFAIGPAIENGFYYDFDVDVAWSAEDLEKIEREMKKITKEGFVLEKFTLARSESLELLKDEPYKVELIEDLPSDAEISFYKQGEFVDLCAGPHLPDIGRIKAIKLLNVTGAYWRGDAKRKMLQRIYGVSFPKAAMLEAHLAMLEEAKKRDHRKIGQDLGLFTFFEEGPGFPTFLPKGMELKNRLLEYWREIHKEAGYEEISSPMIMNKTLWETSGHWYHYRENMYTTKIDEQDFVIKPMNCPGSLMVYNHRPHSYRDLPIRMAELGLVHRHELSGALHGLMRVRCFTQDDAHIYMRPDQIKDEIKGVVALIDKVYKAFGFEYHVELSTHPEESLGTKEQWDEATSALRDAITEMGFEYKLNEGDGAFYGPKLDFHLRDCLGRTWQCGTVQLDFQLPERFGIEYTGSDDQKHRPVMIHRVVYGSIERFIGIITEHFAGAFPLWLAPEQVTVLPISEKQNDKVTEVAQKLRDAGFEVTSDLRGEKIGFKIREAQLQKIPYMLVIGDKEASEGTVSVRSRSEGDLGVSSIEDFIEKISIEKELKK